MTVLPNSPIVSFIEGAIKLSSKMNKSSNDSFLAVTILNLSRSHLTPRNKYLEQLFLRKPVLVRAMLNKEPDIIDLLIF